MDDFHIDAMTVHLLRRASAFDVVVAENMFGDILSDMAGELAGSLGIAPSINASDDRCMAQASHGSAPDIEGLANPIAMILSAGMLLDWLGTRHDDPRDVRRGRRGAGGGSRGHPGCARRGAGVPTAVVAPVAAKVEDAASRAASCAGDRAHRDLGGQASTEEFTDAVIGDRHGRRGV